MSGVRSPLLLALALFGAGCAQGSADWSYHSADPIERPEDLIPVVVPVTRDAGARPEGDDAARGPADTGTSSTPPREVAPRTDAGAVIDPAADAGALDEEELVDAALPQELPQTASACAAGTYVGNFAGELLALGGYVRVDVTGSIEFELPASESNELTLTGGRIVGRDVEGHPMQANVSGRLDCSTGKLEDGRITEGSYTRPDPVFRGRTTTSRFSGVITATFFTGELPTAQGRWDVESERSTRSGSGSFSVQLAR